MSQRGMDWRNKREQSWGLFALAGLLAVVALLPGRWKGPPWAVFALAVSRGTWWLRRRRTGCGAGLGDSWSRHSHSSQADRLAKRRSGVSAPR